LGEAQSVDASSQILSDWIIAGRKEALPGKTPLINQCEMQRPLFLSQRRGARLGIGACLLTLGFLLCLPTWAQHGKTASAPAPAQPEVPKDFLGRSTPRGAVLGFLGASHRGDDELAAQYLNTPVRGNAAAVLAHQLFTVLDRRLPARLNELSDNPEGSLSDPLKPDQELVGTISSDNGKVDIFVERVDRGKSGPLWLFSSNTLDAIPDLYDEINVVSVDTVLPRFLVNTRFAGIPVFEWLAVLVGVPLLYFLTVLLSRLISRLIGLLRRRLYRKPDLANRVFLPAPVRLLLLAFIINWLASKVSLPLLARQFWSSTATIITIAAGVWLLILFISWGEEYTQRLLRNRNRTGATSMLHLTRWVADLLVIIAGVVLTLRYFQVNPTAALAGFGVGGIAVAFAAQKTLENVIGGVSLIFDQAVRVGDNLKVGDAQGTVEAIGLRSTRIRTADRTVVSVPNGRIANMTLENISSRDKFLFHPILTLRYGTTSSQMQTVLHGIRKLLGESRDLEPASARARFLRFGPSSLDVDVFAYVRARDWNQFLEIQESLLLRIIDCIESIGVQFALPLQTIVAAASTSNGATERALLRVPTPEEKPSDEVTAAKSA
jgi:MscS family membrane protein